MRLSTTFRSNHKLIQFPVGHSLGGGLAALVGTTFGVPVVAFESPGDKTAAARLHLPSPVRESQLSYLEATLGLVSSS